MLAPHIRKAVSFFLEAMHRLVTPTIVLLIRDAGDDTIECATSISTLANMTGINERFSGNTTIVTPLPRNQVVTIVFDLSRRDSAT